MVVPGTSRGFFSKNVIFPLMSLGCKLSTDSPGWVGTLNWSVVADLAVSSDLCRRLCSTASLISVQMLWVKFFLSCSVKCVFVIV